MSDDAMKALDQIEAALKPFASVLRNNGELYEPDWITRDDCKSAARALSLLPTLRAALTPPADDEIEAIKERHQVIEVAELLPAPADIQKWYTNAALEAHADRATLLKALDAERQRRVEVEGALATMTDCQPLPKVYKYTGTAEVDVENMFDVGHRHRNGKQPRDYLMSWLSMFRPFAYATKDDSWGELEKLISIVMNNYVQILARAEKFRTTLTKETP